VGQGIITRRGWRQKRVLGATIFLICLEMYYAVRMVLGGGDSRAILAVVTFLLNGLYFSMVLPNRLQSPEEFRKTMYAVALAGGLLATGILYQMASNAQLLYLHGRMVGTAINANHCGHLIATMLPPLCWLGFAGGVKKSFRVGCLIATGLLAFWLVQTGSRGAILALLVAIPFCLRSQLKRIRVYGAVFVVFAAVWLQFNKSLIDDNSRLRSLQDTRSDSWMRSLEMWAQSPVWGYAEGSPVFTENSYIAAAAGFGIVGAVLIGSFVAATLTDLRQINRDLRRFPQFVMPVDMITGGILGILTSGCFEALLLGIYTPWVFTLFCYLALLAYLKDYGHRWNTLAGASSNYANQGGGARCPDPLPLRSPHPV
jgi:O-antigen ligase